LSLGNDYCKTRTTNCIYVSYLCFKDNLVFFPKIFVFSENGKTAIAKTLIFISIPILLCLAFLLLLNQENIDYNIQVKPIVNTLCISCHGDVKQNGGLSLLFEDQAKKIRNPDLQYNNNHPVTHNPFLR